MVELIGWFFSARAKCGNIDSKICLKKESIIKKNLKIKKVYK